MAQTTRPTSSRGNPSLGDIVRTTFVMGVIVLALYGIGRFFTVTPDEPTRSVDYALTVEQVRRAADYPVLAPPSLPEGWRATSARYEREIQGWHLGVLSSDDEYLGLEQSTLSEADAVDRWAEGSRADGTTETADRTWQVRTDGDGRVTYVSADDGVTTLVTTSGDRALLDRYVSSLSSD